jgi:protoheme ferro-lyase
MRKFILAGAIMFASTAYSKVGVLLASHGDIDELSELEDYIKTAFRKNVGIPFPGWVRPVLSEPAYRLSVGAVKAQYEVIGATRYRANSQMQAEFVTQELKKSGLDAKAYYGFNFANPLIEDTLAQMRRDGITTIVVFNKGAQYSFASSGENIEDVRAYLAKNPGWDVEAIGFRQFSEDQRFRQVWKNAIEGDIKKHFPGTRREDICVFLGSHGLPTRMTKAGDPAIAAMLRAIDWLRTEGEAYRIYHGFLNDDFIPGATWSTPNAATMAEQVRRDGCTNVLMDGRLSFTTHHRATLFDMDVEARKTIVENNSLKPKVILGAQFDNDQGFAALIATLTREALSAARVAEEASLRVPDIEVIKRRGGALLKRPAYPN